MTGTVPITKEFQKRTRLDRFLVSKFWRALTGKSDDVILTFVLVVIVSKFAFSAIWLFLVPFASGSAGRFSGRQSGDLGRDVFVLVFFCPIFETSIVWFSLWLLGSILRVRRRMTVALAGLIHVPLHGLVLVSFSVLPFFLLNALILQNYRDRGRSGAGYTLLIAIHAFFNGAAIGLVRVL